MAGGVKDVIGIYWGSRDIWHAFGCLLAGLTVCVVMAAGLARVSGQDLPAKTSDDRARAAKAALALSAAGAPDKCECATALPLAWKDGVKKALENKVPLVVFADGEPRCSGSAIPVQMTMADSGTSPDYPIVVYIPDATGAGLKVFRSLPKGATREKIVATVKDAEKKIAGKE